VEVHLAAKGLDVKRFLLRTHEYPSNCKYNAGWKLPAVSYQLSEKLPASSYQLPVALTFVILSEVRRSRTQSKDLLSGARRKLQPTGKHCS
jgi:hypothetical protein